MAETQEYRYDVFISYSHVDKAWVNGELLPRLEEAGLKVCIDQRDFRPGSAERQRDGAGGRKQSQDSAGADASLPGERLGRVRDLMLHNP